MSESKEFPSRLGTRSGGAPARGLGSGFAPNQALAGARDPEAAARLAALDPSEAEEKMEEAEQRAADLKEKMSDLLEALESGQWVPKDISPPPGANWQLHLSRQRTETIEAWHKAYLEQREMAIEGEDEEHLRQSLREDLSIQPDDPQYDPMVDKARRAAIEAKLKPLDFEQMVFQGYVEQDVPLHPSLSITLRTLSTQQGLWVEYYISKLPEMSNQNLRHTFSLLQVAVSLEKINGKPVEHSLEKLMQANQRDEFIAALEQRMSKLGRLPGVLTDDFIIQYIWFTGRVRKMLAGNLTDRVGNY